MDYFGPHVFGYLIAIIHSLGTIAAIHAVFTVRTAQGAIAWAMSLLFIPYLTLIPYLVFGRSTFDAYIKARRQASEKEMRKSHCRPQLAPLGRRSAGRPRLKGLCLVTSHAQTGPHAVPGE